MHVSVLVVKLEKNHHFALDGRVVLKCVLNKMGERMSEDNIKMDYVNNVGEHGVDSRASGYGQLRCFEHGHEITASINCREFLD